MSLCHICYSPIVPRCKCGEIGVEKEAMLLKKQLKALQSHLDRVREAAKNLVGDQFIRLNELRPEDVGLIGLDVEIDDLRTLASALKEGE